MADETRLHLRDYLVPGGKHSYAELAPLMEALADEGHTVLLVSVPGHLMAMNQRTGPYRWSDCNGTRYRTAADLLVRKNGYIPPEE